MKKKTLEVLKIKTKKRIGVVIIAMVLLIAFSEVALASRNVPPTPETETLTITTEIVCDRKVIEREKLNWECSSKNLDNILQGGEKTGQIKYKEIMIGSGGATEFTNNFKMDTGKTPNVGVTKSFGYTADPETESTIRKLHHKEKVAMSLISKASCVYVAAGSSMSMTKVQATTETKAQMTRTPELHYEIYAGGIEGPGSAAEGTISAGMSAFVEDKRKSKKLGSELKLGYKTTASGSFEFYKVMDFKP